MNSLIPFHKVALGKLPVKEKAGDQLVTTHFHCSTRVDPLLMRPCCLNIVALYIAGTGSVGLGMESLDGKELFKGKAFVQDPECDSRDLMRGKVGSDKVMQAPVAI